jgi:riboflavin kinase/FMN adenylyltransferase
MQVIEDIKNFRNNGLVLTIGFFDGVHAGHRFLIEQMDIIAQEEGLESAVLTFWPHPRLVLNETYKPRLLNTLQEKIRLLERLPLDYCIITRFTKELADYSAFEFMKEILQQKLNVKHLLIGYDHRFGKNREEGFEDYVKYGKELGIEVTQTKPYIQDGYTISSSFIRRLLHTGNVELTATYLGYPYKIKGTVVKGFQLGRKIGFPTANIHLLSPFKCVPDVGAYAVWVNINDKTYQGMLYIGSRPTVANGEEPSIEVNIFNFNNDLYGQEITITFVERIRAQEKFPNIQQLKEQLKKDKNTAIHILENKLPF